MDAPQDTKETNETPAAGEKLSSQGIAAMQGETAGTETSPQIEVNQNPEPVKPAEPEPTPDDTPISMPQVGIGEIGKANQVEGGSEVPEKKLFTIPEDEAKKAKEKEIYHSHGPEGGF